MMFRRKFLTFLALFLIVANLTWLSNPVLAADPPNGKSGLVYYRGSKVSDADRQAAAARVKAMMNSVKSRQTQSYMSGNVTPLLRDPATGVLIPDYFGDANWAYSPLLRKFVDSVAGLGPSGNNTLGQYIPVAVADNTTYPGSDYYEIAVVEYQEKMHSDLPPTRLRGYVQLSTTLVPGAHIALSNPDGSPINLPNGTRAYGVDNPHYLGPTIVATGALGGSAGVGRPVRIKFYNLLPTGVKGNLFIPVDTTVMGAGMGPDMSGANYTQNRATLHLHGNNTVWISDGTPHQWITPANEATPYPKGVSVVDVPDMPASENGTMTIFYSNAQSARLQFYHDHSFGITRLNAYAGEAAGYVITDTVEQDLINGTNNSGVNPGLLKVLPGIGTPLVIQDKTFVDPATIGATDPTWLDAKQSTYGTNPGTAVLGDLWYPHIYVPAQNPWDIGGVNAFGRWMYGPWFYPPTVNLDEGTKPNPYYDPVNAPWEPPEMPGVPNPSMPGEAFMDTPMVNGTVYPYMNVEPKAYRFRILSGADDRFFNLQMYVADNASYAINASGNATAPGTGFGTEVRMVPASNNATFPSYANGDAVDWPTDGRDGGVPDPTTRGPDWIQIGTEGGFMPYPVVVPNQPVGWNQNPTAFNVGNVDRHSLLLGTAERADVIVDFAAFAGKTIILYNDAPAAFPARVPQYDYYTGNLDLRDSGGTNTTQPGFGPNTRTIMQIRVGNTVTTPTTDVSLANLQAVWAKTAGKRGVFEVSQDPIIIPQAAYNSAYSANYTSIPAEEYVVIGKSAMSFKPISENGTLQSSNVTVAVQPKGAHDEMGGVYDTQFGRMSGMLGLEIPGTTSRIGQFIPYGYASPPVEIIAGSVAGTMIGSLDDGTQLWNLTHNGVDTHTIHTHLFNAQIINRVGWDGMMLPPDETELGWKETFRMNPLEMIFLAVRPITPNSSQIPFIDKVPNSVRLIDPTKPEGAVLDAPPPAGWFDTNGRKINSILNHYVNFGWEYVYHCHILAHEEMDMMHDVSLALAPGAPYGLTTSANVSAVNLAWTDNSSGESNWVIQRSSNTTGTTNFATIATVASTTGANITATVQYADHPTAGDTYYYRVIASNVVGDVTLAGFPTITRNSVASNSSSVLFVPGLTTVALTGMTASPGPLVVNNSGVVQTTTTLTGAGFTINVPAGAILLNAASLPLSSMSYTAPGTLPAQPNTQVLLSGFTFGPNGATFTGGNAVTITFSYNPNGLPAGVLPANLTVSFWNGTAWVPLTGLSVNTVTNTITATLQHFTDFALTGAASSVALGTNWNTLATPVKLQTATDTWGELATANGLSFTAAYYWNGTAFLWVDSTREITPLDAIYVKMNVGTTVPFVPYNGISAPYSRNLTAGWNLVGSAFVDPTKAVNAALLTAYLGTANVTGYSQVISPSGVNQNPWTYGRDDTITTQLMQMGKGYWVFMTNPATIAGFTTTP